MKQSPRFVIASTLVFAVSVLARQSSAQMCPAGVAGSVCQPTGEVMPQPVGVPEIGVVASRGFPTAPTNMSAITLEGLFFYRGEAIDPIKDAHITPGTFSPMCGFTGQLVLRGGGCNLVFGWYNVTPGSMTPPPDNQIYPLIPADPRTPPPLGLGCMDGDFCPLATMMTTQAPQHTWTPTPFNAMNIRSNPNYKGGLIGFAIVGSTTTSCAQTKYSQAELNTKQMTTGKPWITTLIWQSTVNPDAYYIGFEDLPLTPATWKGQGGAYVNDGDFNDFVYYITGLNCDGGGKPCATGMPGVCADGTTQCVNGGTIICKPNVASKPESCDGQDNNCDGTIDEGSLCPGAQICDRGVCVNPCNNNEFPCAAGLTCDQGYCKDPSCIGKTCPVGQICVSGACQGGCDGVTCPGKQVCRVGRCVDPCDGVDCAVLGGICENGACVSLCSCRECGAGLSCAGDGHCVDPGCERMTCAAGTICKKGTCQDACTGSKCPVNQACQMGGCVDTTPTGTGGSVGTIVDAGGFAGVFGGSSGGFFGGGSSGGASGASADGNGIAKCGCAVSGLPAGAASLVSVLLAFIVTARRRSRS